MTGDSVSSQGLSGQRDRVVPRDARLVACATVDAPSSGVVDLVGIGIGPSNLSLAALLEPIPSLRRRFFEAAPRFSWHPGLLLPNVTLQVSFLKDLVTLVSPTNRHSFLSFLHETGRLYRFIAASLPQVTRQEFSQYYSWVAERLDCLTFAAPVESVSFDAGCFSIHYSGGVQLARNVVLGTGIQPFVPPIAEGLTGRNVLHASQFLIADPKPAGKRVAVVGGGQSGAEVVQFLLAQKDGPREVAWITRRAGVLPLDDSPFTNERFFPSYVGYFRALSPTQRAQLLDKHFLSSDGASESTLQDIYRRMYELDFLGCDGPNYRVLTAHSVVALDECGQTVTVTATSLETDGTVRIDADIVVLCTGYRRVEPPYLEPLRDRINWCEDWFDVNPDYSISWNGPPDRRIFVQNAARERNGVADSNLSLVPWRSSMIANALAGREVYRTQESTALEFLVSSGHVELASAVDTTI